MVCIESPELVADLTERFAKDGKRGAGGKDGEPTVNALDGKLKSTTDLAFGIATSARIRSIKDTQLNVQLADNVQLLERRLAEVPVVQGDSEWRCGSWLRDAARSIRESGGAFGCVPDEKVIEDEGARLAKGSFDKILKGETVISSYFDVPTKDIRGI